MSHSNFKKKNEKGLSSLKRKDPNSKSPHLREKLQVKEVKTLITHLKRTPQNLKKFKDKQEKFKERKLNQS